MFSDSLLLLIALPVTAVPIMCVWAAHCSLAHIEVEEFISKFSACPNATTEIVPGVCPDVTKVKVIPKFPVGHEATKKIVPEFPVSLDVVVSGSS